MSESDDIDALRAMDRPVTPPREADERIRSLISASIHERATLSRSNELAGSMAEEVETTGEVVFGGNDITAEQHAIETHPTARRWSTAVVLRAAAVVVLIAGLVVGLAVRSDDEPTDVVAAGVEGVELTAPQRICAGSYAQLGDLWRETLEVTTPGFAVDIPRDRHLRILERQHAFLDAIVDELEAGRLSALANPSTLVAARAAVDDSQATFEMLGSTDATATVGISHRLLTQLIEENPPLGEFCDPALIAWPE